MPSWKAGSGPLPLAQPHPFPSCARLLGLEFVRAFLGCLASGVVAVPVSPPSPHALSVGMPAFHAICRDSGAKAILVNSEYSNAVKVGVVCARSIAPMRPRIPDTAAPHTHCTHPSLHPPAAGWTGTELPQPCFFLWIQGGHLA